MQGERAPQAATARRPRRGGGSTTTGSAMPARSRWRSTPTRTTRASCWRSSSRPAATCCCSPATPGRELAVVGAARMAGRRTARDAHGQVGRPARAHGALQGRSPRQPQRDAAREGPRADGERRARRDDPREPRDGEEDGLAHALPAAPRPAGGENARPGDGRGARPRRREAPKDLSEAAWKQFLARTDVQPGWVDYTLEWS